MIVYNIRPDIKCLVVTFMVTQFGANSKCFNSKVQSKKKYFGTNHITNIYKICLEKKKKNFASYLPYFLSSHVIINMTTILFFQASSFLKYFKIRNKINQYNFSLSFINNFFLQVKD